MAILASALPGFRDLRAPLVAGYLWLLFAWLLLDPELPPPSGNVSGFVDTLLDLGDTVGRVGIALAVSVAAYLVGSISATLSNVIAAVLRSLRRAVGRVVRATAEAVYYAIDFEPIENVASRIAYRDNESAAAGRLDALIMDRVGFFEDLFQELTHNAARFELSVDRALEPGDEEPAEDIRQARADLSQLNERLEEIRQQAQSERDRLRRELRNELDLPATLLIGDQPETFAEADRIRAESEVRFAVVPPLAALAALLGEKADSLWYLAFIGIVALAIQGVAKQDDARNVIAGAMLFNKAQSAALERWDRVGGEKRQAFETERARLVDQFDDIQARLNAQLPVAEPA